MQLASAHKRLDDGLVGSPLANLFGLHPARMLASDLCFAARRMQVKGSLSEELARTEADLAPFLRYGAVAIHPFFPAPVFEAVRRECREHAKRFARRHPLPTNQAEHGFGNKQPFVGGFDRFDGGTLNRFLNIEESLMPATAAATRGNRLSALCALATAHAPMPEKFSLYQTVQGELSIPDEQQNPHRDTFFSTVKLWIFLDDVPSDVGPFAYAAGSQRMSLRRLVWEYRRAVAASCGVDRAPESRSGSFRVSSEELAGLGLDAPKQMPVAANTLVLADVRGIHCRSRGRPGAQRLSLYANLRRPPFRVRPGRPVATSSR